MQAINLTPDRRQGERFRTSAEEMNQEPTTSEILEAVNEVKDTSPGQIRFGSATSARPQLKSN